MAQRLFFDRVNGQSACAAISGGNQLVTLPLPDAARAVLPFVHVAVPWAKVALDPAVVPHMPVLRRFHEGIITLFFRKGIP